MLGYNVYTCLCYASIEAEKCMRTSSEDLRCNTTALLCLCSSQRHDLFIPRVRTTMAHTRSIASIGPSLWNHLTPFRSFILSAPFFLSLSLALSLIFFLELKCNESASVWLTP